jgi:plasmid stability protein
MASLVIRDLPVDLQRRLKQRAKANRRSLNNEVLMILEGALGRGAWTPTIEEIDDLRVRGARPLTQEMLDEARESGRP